MKTITQTAPRISPQSDSLVWINQDGSSSPPAARPIVLHYDPQADSLAVELRYETGGTPSDEWHGLALAWSMPTTTDARAMTTAINAGEIDDFLARIAAGHAVRWDGSRHIGVLTDDARSAAEAIDAWIDNAATVEHGLVEAGDWLGGYSTRELIEEYDFSAETDDDALAAIAVTLEEDATAEGASLAGADRWLEGKRDELRQEAEDDDA